MISFRLTAPAACVAALLSATGARGQPLAVPSKPAETQPAPAAQDSLGRSTPRGTVLGFLNAARNGDDKVAIRYLNTNLHGEAAARLVKQLFVVLDTRLPAKLTQLSENVEGSAPDPLHPLLEPIGSIAREDGDFDIMLERINRAAPGWIWLFSRKTLDLVPEVYDEVGRVSIEALLPQAFVTTRIAGIRLFEWIALLFCVPALYLGIALVNRLLKPLFPKLLPFPVRLLLLAGAIQWMLSEVGFPILARQVWSAGAVVIAAVAIVWLLILLNGTTERLMIRRFNAANSAGAASLARVARRAIDVFVIVAAFLLVLHHLGVNPGPALAGLGVGGIAVALAAQKTLENVIAGISLIFDEAVRVGDELQVGGTVGTVVYIGLRSTRIRTLDRTMVSVPNGQIASMTVEALSARDKFWFHPLVSLDLATTAAQLRSVLEGTRELLAENTLVDQKRFRVRLLRLGTASLDVDVSAYVIASDADHFFEIQEELLLGVMEVVRRSGTTIAFPLRALSTGT